MVLAAALLIVLDKHFALANDIFDALAAADNIAPVGLDLLVDGELSTTVSLVCGRQSRGGLLGFPEAAPLVLPIPAAVPTGTRVALAPTQPNAFCLLKV